MAKEEKLKPKQKPNNEQNKKYLIIPAAGKSSRYSTDKPKYLLTHPHGRLMIQEVVLLIPWVVITPAHIKPISKE